MPPVYTGYTWFCADAIGIGDAVLIGVDLGVEGPYFIFLQGGLVGY